MRKFRAECKPCHLKHRWGLHPFKEIEDSVCQRFCRAKCQPQRKSKKSFLPKTKEEFEEKKVEISNIKMVNMAEIEKLMIAPSSRLEKVKSTEKTIATQLPGLQRNFFSFEANEIPEAPKALVKFLEKHIQAAEADKESSSTQS
jgi:hypothetical protein